MHAKNYKLSEELSIPIYVSLHRRTAPVPPDLDVVMRKCYQGRSLKFVTEHGLEHGEERVTARMEGKAYQ